MVPASRREARERALELLYEAEAKDLDPLAVIGELQMTPDAFTVDLVEGVAGRRAEVDEVLVRHLRADWRMDRVAAVDRAILRLGTFELLGRDDVPTAVVLSEAVELAKRYSTEDSGRFVNGVLAAVARDVRAVPSPGVGEGG